MSEANQPDPHDPFREARREKGVLACPFQGEDIPMILRHADLRAAAKDWDTFTSDRAFRVPIPSEEDMRTVRQLPIERDPPEHTEYRKLVEPFFKRPRNPEYVAMITALVGEMLEMAIGRDSIEAMNEFALPMQSRALTYLLNVPESEADTWIGWGIHVFHGDSPEEVKGSEMERYIDAQLDRAEANPGEDFFSALTQMEYQGRKLTREEMAGFGNVTFAGGRDTVIHTITSVLAYTAEHPEMMDYLREDPKRAVLAGEEFLRWVSPITHLGRVCPNETEVQGVTVPPEGRVSLCWASANRDEEVFEAPGEIRLDRKPNPHVAFGVGAHFCLGAAHMRAILRALLEQLAERVERIEILAAEEHVEEQAAYRRENGYDSLTVAVSGR